MSKLKKWIRQRSVIHNKWEEDEVKFAEFWIDDEAKSQNSTPTKWFVGMAIIKPHVKYDILFTTRCNEKII